MSIYNDEIWNAAHSFEGLHGAYGAGQGHLDCSHFVQHIIEIATRRKFHYLKANDYAHATEFREKEKPARGDIFFQYHSPLGLVGIILDPHTGLYLTSTSAYGVVHEHMGHSRHHHKILEYIG